MKKTLSSLVLCLATTTLVACASKTAAPSVTSSSTSSIHVSDDKKVEGTFKVTFDGKTTEKKVMFELGDSVMDVLEDNFRVEENDGLVTAIDGVSQDPGKKLYWMYRVNDKVSEVGAEDYDLKAGDRVEFYLEAF